MERIKEALEKAREQRGLEGSNDPQGSGEVGAAGSRLGNYRILEREPFRQFSATQQRGILETGRFLNVAAGETLQFAGDKNPYVHYLLSGTVVIGADDDTRTLSADQDTARRPLDVAGVKAGTVTATTDAEILRVPYAVLPATVDVEDEAPLPTSAYTETYSGQQLADLVEQIAAEHGALDSPGASIVDPQVLLGEKGSPVDGTDLSESVDSLLADLEVVGAEPTLEELERTYAPKVDDELGRFTRDLELRFRRYVEKVKADERARYEAQLQKHAGRLQKLAEEQVRAKLSTLRERYQNAYLDKERRLRDRYNALRVFANKVTRQKAAIYVARQQIKEKLQLVEQVNLQLSQLGRRTNHQLDDLDDLMPAGPAQESTGTDPD